MGSADFLEVGQTEVSAAALAAGCPSLIHSPKPQQSSFIHSHLGTDNPHFWFVEVIQSGFNSKKVLSLPASQIDSEREHY